MKDLRTSTTSQLLLAPAASAGVCLAFLGLVESFYVAPFHLPSIIYATGLYGLVGIGTGFLWGLFFGGKARRKDFGILSLVSSACIWPTFILSSGIAGFLIWRDLWAESIGSAGVAGWAAMIGMPVLTLILSQLGGLVGRSMVDSHKKWLMITLVLYAVGLLSGRAMEVTSKALPEVQKGTGKDNRTPVIIIVSDALRADALGTYGNSPKASPNFDEFAKHATVFSEAWSASTWTRPSVASILTGQPADVHKTMHKSDRLPENLPTLAGMLRSRGYITVASVTNVNLAPAFGLGRGFDVWGYLAPRPYLMAPVSARRLFLVELWRLFRLRFFPGHRQVSSYYAEGYRVTQQAEDLLQPLEKAGRPFFAYIHYMETHDPYFAHPYDGTAVARVENPNPPIEKAKEYRKLYQQEVSHWDTLLGKLIKWLKTQGIYDKALIVITADHGEEFADHGHFWHGTSIYRELVRVPLVVHFPEGKHSGIKVTTPVSLIDLAPTILKQAGVKNTENLPGINLESAMTLADRPVFASVDHQGSKLHAVRLGNWKLVIANKDNHRGLAPLELFDLSNDPGEKKNLSTTNQDMVGRLQELIEKGPQAKAPSPDVVPAHVEVDQATEEQLRSLGYTQ